MSEEIYINSGNTFQQPYTARVPANAQTPVSARQPARQPAQGRTPFTYQNRSPFTYRNPVSGQQPYIANAQAPYPYIANSQTPYIANAQQPYPYIANAQQPYIANAQTPFTYQARSPFTYNATGRTPFTYNNRSPFTYTRQGRSPFTYSAQNPFTYSARTPFTYNARQPFTYNARTPFTYNARSPAPAIGTQSVPVIEIDVATDFNTLSTSPYTSASYSGYSAVHPAPQSYLTYDKIDISNSQAGNTSTNISPLPTVSQCALVSGNYYGVSTNNYFAYCYLVQNSGSSTASLVLAIANYANGTSSAGAAYSSGSGSSILGVKIWGPTSWPRGSTPDYTYTTSSAASVNYSSSVARFTGSTFVSDPTILWSWNVSGISASFLGNQSNASNNNANGIFRFQIYDV